MEAMIMIGANPESVREVGEFIIRIIDSSGCDEVKLEGLKALKEASSVVNTSIYNCNFWGDGKTDTTRHEGDDPSVQSGERQAQEDQEDL